jgi:hypothetical protein
MADRERQAKRDEYRPITEGYQPGQPQPIRKGYVPASDGGETVQSAPLPPPSGGSSAAKPAQKKTS